MQTDYSEIEQFIRAEVAAITQRPAQEIDSQTPLIGSHRVMDSADLVMLMLSVEDFARDSMGVHWDWSSDSAMSEARSVLRTVGSLARHLSELNPA